MLNPLHTTIDHQSLSDATTPLAINSQTKLVKDPFQSQDFISQITISDVQFFSDQNSHFQQNTRKIYKPTTHTANAANIFRVKFGGNVERRDKATYIKCQNFSSARSKKTTEQKIFQINNFVKKLTENVSKDEQVPEISQTKFKALKKIIQYYDIKNLDRSEYSNVIKSFGLQIGSVRAETKVPSYSEEKIKKLKIVSLFKRTQKNISQNTALNMTMNSSQQSSVQVVRPRQIVSEQESKTRTPKSQGRQMFNSLQMRKERLKVKSPKKFKFNGGQNCIIQKVNKYRQFLFILNYSNRLYRPLDIQSYPTPLRFYIGRGNNGNLIRSLMRRRFWFQETTNEKEAQFVWTQIKVTQIFAKQNSIEAGSAQTNPKSSRRFPPKIVISKSDPLARILTNEQLRQIFMVQQLVKTRNIQYFQDRLKIFGRAIKKQQIIQSQTVHNHLPGNGLLGNKKAMFLCLRQYCRLTNLNIFDIVPKTFIVSNGLLDPQYGRIAAYFSELKQSKKPNFWIMKPGEFSNRGNGIQCTNKLQDIRKRVNKISKQRKKGSLIIQQYIIRPLLYNGRKFDIRAYMIITWHNSKAKAYWYQDGYVRTSSAFFSLEQMGDPYIHLTNDAVQKNSDRYGHFEDGNKLSYPELQRYLDSLPALGRTLDLYNVLLPKMKEIAGLTVRAAWGGLNRNNKDKNFELFGLDFMVDQYFKPWLIQVNTNPCLELSSPVLERLIPHMVQNVLRISVDTLFPPPDNFNNNYKYNIPENSLHYNKFQIIFDSDRDGPAIKAVYQGHDFFKELDGLEQDKNQYKQEGELINIDDI